MGETSYDRRYRREQERSKKFGRKKFDYISKEEALKNKPKDIKNDKLWKRAVNSVFEHPDAKIEMKDVITHYNYLLKIQRDVHGKYGKKNEDMKLPEKLPTFEGFVQETLKVGDRDIQEIIDDLYRILQGVDNITSQDIIDGLKNEFELEVTDDQLSAIISGIMAKGIDIREDKIGGGRADDKNPDDFDPFELELGVAVEAEHTDDPELAEEIAMDHLEENGEYYTDGFKKGIFDEDISSVLDKWKDDPRAQELMDIENGNS